MEAVHFYLVGQRQAMNSIEMSIPSSLQHILRKLAIRSSNYSLFLPLSKLYMTFTIINIYFMNTIPILLILDVSIPSFTSVTSRSTWTISLPIFWATKKPCIYPAFIQKVESSTIQ